MSLPQLWRRREVVVAPPAERPDVRRYRYLLQALDGAVMERLHADALASLDPLVRANILRTAQERLLSGRDLTVDDVARIARLITTGERRTPGIVVSGLAEVSLERLAHRVARRAEAQELLEGYDAWDGSTAPARAEVPGRQAFPSTSSVVAIVTSGP